MITLVASSEVILVFVDIKEIFAHPFIFLFKEWMELPILKMTDGFLKLFWTEKIKNLICKE